MTVNRYHMYVKKNQVQDLKRKSINNMTSLKQNKTINSYVYPIGARTQVKFLNYRSSNV